MAHLYNEKQDMNAFKNASCFVLLALGSLALVACGDDGTTPDPPATPEVVTIAEARTKAAGTTAIVEGYLTIAPGVFNSATGEKGFAIQDDTAGIYVTMADAVDAAVGDKVRVEGKLAQSAQFTVLEATPAAVSKQSGTKDVAPKVVKTSEINEANEGLLVRTSGKVTKPVGDDTPYGYKVFIDDGSGEIQVFVHIVDGAPIIDTATIMLDQTIEVMGLSAQYETTYEIMPGKAADLVVP